MTSDNYLRRSYSLTPDLVNKLERIAELEDRSMSAAVRQALRAYIDSKEQEYEDLQQEDLFED